jgi:hypothetical protein
MYQGVVFMASGFLIHQFGCQHQTEREHHGKKLEMDLASVVNPESGPSKRQPTAKILSAPQSWRQLAR